MRKSLAVLIILLFQAAAYSAEGTIKQLVEEVSQEKEKLLEKEQQKRNILGELYTVNKNLKVINREKSKIQKNLTRAGENVTSLGVLISQLEQKISVQRVKLRTRMKALSKLHGQNATKLLFASQNSSELDSNLKLFRIITEKDFRLLKSYKENIKVYRAQKSKLDFQEKKYASLKKSLDEKEKDLAKQMDRKSQMIKYIDSDRLLHLTKLKRLKLKGKTAANADVELRKIEAIESLLRPQMFEKKGALISPVEGNVVKKYGFFDDPSSKTKIRFKGQLFQAKRGTKVKSIFEGQVVFAGWVDGYGKTVIIDHGDQYYSVYANASSLEVDVGDNVGSGSVVGYVGESITYLGKGLYFELRHFSEPEDPEQWIKGS